MAVGMILVKGNGQKMRKEIMEYTLLPCPFCGSEAVIVEIRPHGGNKYYYPTCIKVNCPAHTEEQDEQGGTHCDCLTIEEAVKLWNIRYNWEKE